MMHSFSPLRYPGGKARLAWYVEEVMLLNGLDGDYVEPYCGGASVALALLFSGGARRVHINDADPNVFAFWSSVLRESERFCDLVRSTPLNVDEWQRQRSVYRDAAADEFARGFATFYLNRTNRSGIIRNGGVIGGMAQTGRWTIGARYPVEDLIGRLQRVAEHADRISLTCEDALTFLRGTVPRLPARSLVYLDPPYYEKGQGLYRNAYAPDDHGAVAGAVSALRVPWIVSYDNRPEIQALYEGHPRIEYSLGYTATRTRTVGSEVMFFSKQLLRPAQSSPIRVRKRRASEDGSQLALTL